MDHLRDMGHHQATLAVTRNATGCEKNILPEITRLPDNPRSTDNLSDWVGTLGWKCLENKSNGLSEVSTGIANAVTSAINTDIELE